MTAIIAATPAAPRRAIVVGTKEVTFTPYVIRKVGEVRDVTIDGVAQKVIYNERRNLTYLTLDEVTGRIAAELEADGSYDSVVKATKATPPAGKRTLKTTPAAETPIAVTITAPAPEAKKERKPKAAA